MTDLLPHVLSVLWSWFPSNWRHVVLAAWSVEFDNRVIDKGYLVHARVSSLQSLSVSRSSGTLPLGVRLD